MSTEQPARLSSENGMIKQPITVDRSEPRQYLDRMSRLNFRKVYVVEHDVKVMDVGFVSRDSLPYLISYWGRVIIS